MTYLAASSSSDRRVVNQAPVLSSWHEHCLNQALDRSGPADPDPDVIARNYRSLRFPARRCRSLLRIVQLGRAYPAVPWWRNAAFRSCVSGCRRAGSWFRRRMVPWLLYSTSSSSRTWLPQSPFSCQWRLLASGCHRIGWDSSTQAAVWVAIREPSRAGQGGRRCSGLFLRLGSVPYWSWGPGHLHYALPVPAPGWSGQHGHPEEVGASPPCDPLLEVDAAELAHVEEPVGEPVPG
jgi:hypothetical protein